MTLNRERRKFAAFNRDHPSRRSGANRQPPPASRGLAHSYRSTRRPELSPTTVPARMTLPSLGVRPHRVRHQKWPDGTATGRTIECFHLLRQDSRPIFDDPSATCLTAWSARHLQRDEPEASGTRRRSARGNDTDTESPSAGRRRRQDLDLKPHLRVTSPMRTARFRSSQPAAALPDDHPPMPHGTALAHGSTRRRRALCRAVERSHTRDERHHPPPRSRHGFGARPRRRSTTLTPRPPCRRARLTIDEP